VTNSGTGGWTDGLVSNGDGGHLEITITGGSGHPQVFVDFPTDGFGLTEVDLRDSSGNPLTMPLGEGTHQVYFNIPDGTFGDGNISLPVRVRLSSLGDLQACGEAPDGEVEDYIWEFGPNAVTLTEATTSPFAWAPLALGVVAVGAVLGIRRRRNR
jgi:MYXO-CTERM domain-containing protein